MIGLTCWLSTSILLALAGLCLTVGRICGNLRLSWGWIILVWLAALVAGGSLGLLLYVASTLPGL